MDEHEILNYLLKHPEYVDILNRAIEVEEAHANEQHWLGWEWHHVRGHTGIINKLVVDGLVEVAYSSRSGTNYRLVSLQDTKEAIKEFETLTAEPVAEEAAIPPDLFDAIVGYERVKELFWDAIRSENPCHILLVGPPASAKSMFLLELDRLPNSHFCLGGQTSKVGIADEMFDHSPKYLIIDELDDMPRHEQSVLKSLMWDGVVARRKHQIRQRGTFKTWVFGGCNKLERLSDAVRSRFVKVRFQPYTEEQFREVVVSVLTKRENVDEGLAGYIAEEVGKYTRDPREAISLARAAKTREKVDRYVKLLWGSQFLEEL